VALEHILAAIRSEADSEICRIRSESADMVGVILDGARREAKSIREAAAGSLDDEATQERARIVNRSHLVAERRLRAAAEETYLELYEDVILLLARRRDAPDYPELFGRLFEECRAVLPDGRMLRIDPADEEIAARAIARSDDEGYSIDPSIVTMGGLELATEDRRRRVRNTFEARLERGDRPLRALAATMVPALHGGG
jgi:vacuolar-type H+-ATPase subunit E/Vma4